MHALHKTWLRNSLHATNSFISLLILYQFVYVADGLRHGYCGQKAMAERRSECRRPRYLWHGVLAGKLPPLLCCVHCSVPPGGEGVEPRGVTPCTAADNRVSV